MEHNTTTVASQDVKLKTTEVKPSGVKGIVAKIKGVKHIELILAGVAVLVMLLIYFSSGLSFGGSSSSNAAQTNRRENHIERIERQLNEYFSLLDGAGDTRIIINWESGIETILAYVTTQNQNSSSSGPQIINIGGGAQAPIVIKEIYPRALGVVIITQGGDNVRLQLAMINAVSVLLELTPDRIQVLPMRR